MAWDTGAARRPSRMQEADEDASLGRTRPAEEVLAEIEAEEAAARRQAP